MTDEPLAAEAADEPNPVTEPAPAHPLHKIVDDWFFEFMPNSPLATNAAAYAHVAKAKEELKARLAAA